MVPCFFGSLPDDDNDDFLEVDTSFPDEEDEEFLGADAGASIRMGGR
jgi:hypothetical protein